MIAANCIHRNARCWIQCRSTLRTIALGLLSSALLILLMGPARAENPLKLTDMSYLDLDEQFFMAFGHPNEILRIRGLKSHVSGDDRDAINSFRRAAEYADKFSQHYLSLLYWNGQGTAVDRVQAYIWSDLAAERGGRELLLIRERMWSLLNEAEREHVRTQGPAYYAQYGDRVAKPRMEYPLRKFAQQMTGSRVGYDQGYLGLLEKARYAEARVRPEAYWKAENEKLGISNARVEVGPVEQASPQSPPHEN